MADQVERTRWRRAARGIRTVTITTLVMAGSGGAVAVGAEFLANRAEATAVVDTADPTPVQVAPLVLTDSYQVSRQFVGQVEAEASVILSFELAGRISELPILEGQRIEEGQLLAQLDTAILRAEQTRLEASRSATAAQLALAESRLLRAEGLRAEGHVSEAILDQALAARNELAGRIREIDAAIDAVAINLGKSELRAPFDGHVGARNAEGGEALAAGAPVLTLIRTDAPQVRIGLPLSLDTHSLHDVSIAVNGATYPARLAQIRPDIDPVTRTRTALFELQTDTSPAFGQTAVLVLDTHITATGAWVPLDALQEGVGGVWTLLVVEHGVVRVAMVELLHADETRAYVRGTFEPGAQMIATGAHRVVPGQRVRALAAAE